MQHITSRLHERGEVMRMVQGSPSLHSSNTTAGGSVVDQYLDGLLIVLEDWDCVATCVPRLAQYLELEGYIISTKNQLSPIVRDVWLGKYIDLQQLSIGIGVHPQMFSLPVQIFGQVQNLLRLLGLINLLAVPKKGHLLGLAAFYVLLAYIMCVSPDCFGGSSFQRRCWRQQIFMCRPYCLQTGGSQNGWRWMRRNSGGRIVPKAHSLKPFAAQGCYGPPLDGAKQNPVQISVYLTFRPILPKTPVLP